MLKKLEDKIGPHGFDAVAYAFSGTIVLLLFAAIFSALGRGFWVWLKIGFFLFGGAAYAASAVALLFKASPLYGVALYYGTLIISTLLHELIPNDSVNIFVSLVIMALSTYCYYLKKKSR